jgi:hypothetical protein
VDEMPQGASGEAQALPVTAAVASGGQSIPLGHHQVQAKAQQLELQQQRHRAGAAAAMYGEQLLCSFYLAPIDIAR